MRRCHFLGPRFFFFFSRRRQPDPLLLPPLHSVSLASHLQTVCWGFFPVLAPGAPEGHLPRHRRKDRSDPPWRGRGGVRPGTAPRRGRTRFCVAVCLCSRPTPGRRRAGRDPRGGGASAAGSAWCAFHGRGRRRPGLFRYSPCPDRGPPEPRTPDAAARDLRWPPSHPAVLWASPPAC